MSKVERFEQLRVWNDAMSFAKDIRSLCRPLFATDRVLAYQLWRAAISIPSNIAEGFDRYSPKEFARFLLIARGSCAEIRTQLRLAQDCELAGRDQVQPLIKRAQSISAMLTALHSTLRLRN